jgi:AcrR family transcriptional regulator
MAEIQAGKTKKAPVRGKRKLSFKARNPADTKERILVAAIKEFSEYGFLGARVERIVRGSEISMRMLYHYFKNKESLYVAVLERVYQDVRITEQQVDLSGSTPEDAIARLIDFTFDHFAENPDLINLVMAENLLKGEYLRRSELVPSLSRQLQESMKEILDRGAREGTFRPDVDPVQLWISIFSLCWTHLSNRHTLSWMFQTDLSQADWLAARRAHVRQVVLTFLRA